MEIMSFCLKIHCIFFSNSNAWDLTTWSLLADRDSKKNTHFYSDLMYVGYQQISQLRLNYFSIQGVDQITDASLGQLVFAIWKS
jgi:hypothetical protein